MKSYIIFAFVLALLGYVSCHQHEDLLGLRKILDNVGGNGNKKGTCFDGATNGGIINGITGGGIKPGGVNIGVHREGAYKDGHNKGLIGKAKVL
ncbi:hypothetical protein HN011_003745 [Eciton burchellii]|nr:hypothetical protein HN011_003745 [Eciton burchellii]